MPPSGKLLAKQPGSLEHTPKIDRRLLAPSQAGRCLVLLLGGIARNQLFIEWSCLTANLCYLGRVT